MTAVYFFAAMLLVLLAVVLIAPLLDRGPERTSGAQSRLEEALEALRELEFEHETEKISDEDYRVMRARWAKAAIAARDAGGVAGPEDDTRDAGSRCPVCAAVLEEESRFCSRCGSAVPA